MLRFVTDVLFGMLLGFVLILCGFAPAILLLPWPEALLP